MRAPLCALPFARPPLRAMGSARRLGFTPLREATEVADKEVLDEAIVGAVQAVGPTKSRGTAADWLGAIAGSTLNIVRFLLANLNEKLRTRCDRQRNFIAIPAT